MSGLSQPVISSFAEFAAATRPAIEKKLDLSLPSESCSPINVHRAMRWSVFAGGKRFRPLLLVATGQTFGGPLELLLSTAVAFELLHTYSLIHDDLPSMDDDDLRRGQPTCHVRFGEATAILAGDALQTLAFETIAAETQLPTETRLQLLSELARAAGTPAGMIAGQAFDLEAESRSVDANELEQIHRLKTGALILAAARCGAIIASAAPSELRATTKYASQLGLLFQITDDLLDITATAEALGKTPGKDARSSKATYPSLYGIDSARERAHEAYNGACAALDDIERPTVRLRSIADFLIARKS